MNVLFVITSLEMGGAQMMLYEHLKKNRNSEINSHLVSILGESHFTDKLIKLGVPVYHLNSSENKSVFLGINSVYKLSYLLNKIKPDILVSSMVHANLISSIASLFHKKIKIIWSIHNSNLSHISNKLTNLFVNRINSILSRFIPTKIIYCSDYSNQIHENFGYAKEKSVVIFNGIDLKKFTPNAYSYSTFRKEINVQNNTFIIGSIGRYHPIKDYSTFIKSAAIVHKNNPSIHFVLCGDKLSWENKVIVKLIKKNKLERVFHLLGKRKDINHVTSAFDIAVNTSTDESFSLTMAEAMACEIPCVCSDIIGLRALMNNDGIFAEVGNPKDFANKLTKVIQFSPLKRAKIGRKSRKEVEKKYSINKMNDRYLDLYQKLIDA